MSTWQIFSDAGKKYPMGISCLHTKPEPKPNGALTPLPAPKLTSLPCPISYAK
ncbi:hypothetical protein OIU79_028129, partial [Salix purpurea]